MKILNINLNIWIVLYIVCIYKFSVLEGVEGVCLVNVLLKIK